MLNLKLPPTITSGPLLLGSKLRQLRHGGRVLPVSGLPLRILEMLMEAEGRVVSRLELKARLWPHAVRIDVDRRLNTAVRALRRVIEESAAGAGEVQTVRGYGYRWIAARSVPRSHRPPMKFMAATALLVGVAGSTGGEPKAQSIAHSAERMLSSEQAWRRAESLYRQALASQPDLVEAHRGLAWLYVNEQRANDALPHIARLLESPDRSPAYRAHLGWLLLRAGKPDAALAVCSKPDEHTINLLSCRHTALAELGLMADARDTALEVMNEASADETVIRDVRDDPPAAGYATFLRWRVDYFVAPGSDWFQRAQLQAEAGLYRQALDSLEIAAARRDPLLVKIGSTAAFAPLRSTIRFQRVASMVPWSAIGTSS